MSNPWDIPPLPTIADLSQDHIYMEVGRVLTGWEGIEVQLCRIYSFFLDKPDDHEAMQSYGEDRRIFTVRFGELKKQANELFVSRHCQHIEGEFDSLAERLEGFSGRRNDIAHGIVMPVQIYKFFTQAADVLQPRTNYYALVPPYYKWKGHSLDATPAYAYTSSSLLEISKKLTVLYSDLASFREKLRMLIYRS